jgi:hypothetical protein
MLRPTHLCCALSLWASAALALCPNGLSGYSSVSSHNGEQVDLLQCSDGPLILATDTWFITTPDVMQPTTSYPVIRFSANDRVTVTASGCVQTGGWGKTWKRYVDPDFGATTMYRGMIQLPGRPLQSVATVQAEGPIVINTAGWLTLGYVDDDYSDNGYYPFMNYDTGTGNQCAGAQAHNAFLVVTIEHPRCDGVVCGPSRNGLGNCPNTCAASFPSCTAQQTCCAPACAGRACNDSDGCGGTCGCAGGLTCSVGQCVCVPDCSGSCGGPDGCGGTCAAGSGCVTPPDPIDPPCPKPWLCTP